MTFRDEIAFSGNRETIERELSRSVAQVLHLAPDRTALRHRSLQELGVDLVLSVTFLRATRGSESTFATDLADRCTPSTPSTPDALPRSVDSGSDSLPSPVPDSVPSPVPDPLPSPLPDALAADYARAAAELRTILRRNLPTEPLTPNLW